MVEKRVVPTRNNRVLWERLSLQSPSWEDFDLPMHILPLHSGTHLKSSLKTTLYYKEKSSGIALLSKFIYFIFLKLSKALFHYTTSNYPFSYYCLSSCKLTMVLGSLQWQRWDPTLGLWTASWGFSVSKFIISMLGNFLKLFSTITTVNYPFSYCLFSYKLTMVNIQGLEVCPEVSPEVVKISKGCTDWIWRFSFLL